LSINNYIMKLLWVCLVLVECENIKLSLRKAKDEGPMKLGNTTLNHFQRFHRLRSQRRVQELIHMW